MCNYFSYYYLIIIFSSASFAVYIHTVIWNLYEDIEASQHNIHLFVRYCCSIFSVCIFTYDENNNIFLPKCIVVSLNFIFMLFFFSPSFSLHICAISCNNAGEQQKNRFYTGCGGCLLMFFPFSLALSIEHIFPFLIVLFSRLREFSSLFFFI